MKPIGNIPEASPHSLEIQVCALAATKAELLIVEGELARRRAEIQKLKSEVADAESAMFEDERIATWTQESDKQVWVSGEWHDDASGLVIPVKCLID